MNPTTDPTAALATGALLLDRSDRARLEISGPDRARFLHNLTTQEVKRLGAGTGAEAFVTSPQGKTLGYVSLLALDHRIGLRTDAEGLAPITPHLAKYGVFDDVTIDDLTDRSFELHLFGPNAEAVALRAGAELPPAGDLRHAETWVGNTLVRMVRESPAGVPGLTLIGGRAWLGSVREALERAGASLGLVEIGADAFEPLRIEAGTPVAGRDVTPDNLPQEVARDDRAINFVKGCYLGQETVARIDALGHVNRLLRGLVIPGQDAPPRGSALEAGGKTVGTLTSSAFSPGRGCVVALAYVRTTHAEPGTAVRVVARGESPDDPGRPFEAVVTSLPMPPG